MLGCRCHRVAPVFRRRASAGDSVTILAFMAVTSEDTDVAVRRVCIGRTGLLVTLGALALYQGFVWASFVLHDLAEPARGHDFDGLRGFLLYLSIDIALIIGSIYLPIRFVLNRPLRSAVATGRPIRLKGWVAGALVAVCVCSPLYIAWFWALRIHSGHSIAISNAGIDARACIYFVIVLVLTVLRAFGEEVMFRGCLTQLFGDQIFSRIGLAIVVALPFSLSHEGAWASPSYLADVFSVSLLFSALTFASGGIEWAAGYHAAGNLVRSAAMGLFGELPEQYRAWWDWLEGAMAAVHLLLACAIFLWLVRRKSALRSPADESGELLPGPWV